MKELVPFKLKDKQVQVITDEKGDPWFVAKEVCDILGFDRPTDATKYLDADEKGVISNHAPGGIQQMTTINEPGLYSLILRSRKPEAKAFKRWVTHEVLPQIRKAGGYIHATPEMSDDDLLDGTLQMSDLSSSLRSFAGESG